MIWHGSRLTDPNARVEHLGAAAHGGAKARSHGPLLKIVPGLRASRVLQKADQAEATMSTIAVGSIFVDLPAWSAQAALVGGPSTRKQAAAFAVAAATN